MYLCFMSPHTGPGHPVSMNANGSNCCPFQRPRAVWMSHASSPPGPLLTRELCWLDAAAPWAGVFFSLQLELLTQSGELDSGRWTCLANHKEPNRIIRNSRDWAMQEAVAGSSGGVCQGSALRLRGHLPPSSHVCDEGQ